MKINGINVSGIKKAVGDANHEGADNWAITLDLGHLYVMERGLFGQDFLECHWPTIEILGGHGNSIFGRDKTSIAEVKDIIAQIFDVRKKAREAFKRGVHHEYFSSAEEEGWPLFCRTELQAHGLI